MENKRKTGLDIAMMIVRIVYILGYLGMTIFSMTLGIRDLVLSIINKNAPRRKLNIITSVIGVLLPYLTEYLMIAIIGPLF